MPPLQSAVNTGQSHSWCQTRRLVAVAVALAVVAGALAVTEETAKKEAGALATEAEAKNIAAEALAIALTNHRKVVDLEIAAKMVVHDLVTAMKTALHGTAQLHTEWLVQIMSTGQITSATIASRSMLKISLM